MSPAPTPSHHTHTLQRRLKSMMYTETFYGRTQNSFATNLNRDIFFKGDLVSIRAYALVAK